MNLASRLRSERFVIFLFHGVIEKQVHAVRNYTRKHLEQDYFVGCLRSLLAAGGNPVSMDDVANAHASGVALPPKSFAVTFDDGFFNNLSIAAPVLADLSIPATFYVTTDFIGSNRMSWVDRIEWALEQIPSGRLELPWDVTETFAGIEERRRLMDRIRDRVKTDSSISMDGLASDIQTQLGLPETWASEDPLDRKMTWENVGELDSHPLFTVGGHTHTHAILAHLGQPELDRELDTSLVLLREKAGIPSRHYSYPEGASHCYSETVIAALKHRGVVICPTAIDGDNDGETDLFHLRRIMCV